MNQSEILLESGTNELEIMEFTVANEVFGINVAKVREIMQSMPVKPMQNAHPVIEGIYKPREDVITVLSLARYLGLPESEDHNRDIFMITEFNNQVIAFHVHSVIGIDRISWTNIQKPDQLIYGGEEGVATGIAEYDGRLITILDFEKIIAEIAPDLSITLADIELMGERARSEKPILIAEDSMLLAKLILEALHAAGYANVTKMNNGQEAYDFLMEAKASGDSIFNHVACIISDIEMPRMDGHRLTKLVKDDPVLKKVPLILFSSLINEEMKIKGWELGADAQISKPEIANLVGVIDDLIAKSEGV
ncbi:chemotaxis protein [Eubacteriales bacterium OttesenSCG-928-N14]|nr:chemotaxis protein [Eubacteriales bacterium OttesenSCG-928-N14]